MHEYVFRCAGGVQVEWLQPYTDAKIRELGASGVKQLLAVPISFVSEHIETLEEIDMEYRELALESGVQVSGPDRSFMRKRGVMSPEVSLKIDFVVYKLGSASMVPAL